MRQIRAEGLGLLGARFFVFVRSRSSRPEEFALGIALKLNGPPCAAVRERAAPTIFKVRQIDRSRKVPSLIARQLFGVQLLLCLRSFSVLNPSRAFAVRALGIDVSNNNGAINWTSVANSGIDFAWAKATEGTTFTDSYFNGSNGHNMANGTAAGVLMGAYHFARPDLNSDATTEAAHFVAVASPYLTDGYLRPVLDVETGFGLSTTALSNWINGFCSYVTSHVGADADPLIYMSSSPAGSEVNSSVTSHALWVANYPSNADDPAAPTGNPPAGTGVWSDWAFWQYSSKGTSATVAGVASHYVDLDAAHGDINYVRQFLIGGTVPPTSFERFDVNGTAAGSGVASNGSYTWEGAGYSSSAAGTDPTSWNEGNFLRLAAGTDAGASNYTITANSNHTFAGMYLQTSGGGTVTINGPGVLTVASGDQGMYVDTSSQNLKINASLAGTGRLVWQGNSSGGGGSLYLLGNNTYSGGTLLNTTAGLNFNNNNSFGTGRITWGVTQQVLADDVASSPITLPNTVTTRAGGQLIYVGPAAVPVTFTERWTLPSGTSTLTVGNTSHATSKMTISGSIGGSGGALIKDGNGTLVLGGETPTAAEPR